MKGPTIAMSVDKSIDLRSNEIDKSKRRHRTDDTVVATAALTGGGDSQQYAKMEGIEDGAGKPTDLCLQGNLHLVSSTTSSLADTPGDSGVLCLDSEASEVTSQALMSHSLVGAEELACDSLYDAAPSCSQDMIKSTTSSIMTRSDIDNQNMGAADDIVPELLVEANKKSPVYENLPDVVLKALESEKVSAENIEKPSPRPNEPKKSLSEDIVYRRKCRKKSQNGGSQKKRVSFHEDILNNTKTDNIHIERGFISYGPDSSYCDRFRQKNNVMNDRFSWCASGDRSPKYAADVAQQTMSDLLVYNDSNEDRSGIFEYCQNYERENQENDNKDKDNNNEDRPRGKLYGCDSNSSDSNFSCDSETSSSDTSSSHSNKTEATLMHRKCDKAQKSYSCDGFENNAHVAFMRKTYFSEADIDQPRDRTKKPLEVSENPNTVKSVLKKKRYITTNVVEEKKQNSKVLNLLDVNIIDSLKTFYKNFNFNFTPEKGLTENSIELNNVVEALPCDVNQNKKLCKSLDSGFQIDDEDDFVEINLNGQQLEAGPPKDMVSSTKSVAGDKTPNEGSPRHKLTLNMKAQFDKKSANKADAFPSVNKYVVNCESTVYEHKGVSYSYVHDTFQTAFDAPKETFVPIPESTPIKELVTSASKPDFLKQTDTDSSSRASTPKRQFNKNVQDETEQKNGIPKHLSSPKRQNVNRYSRKFTPTQKTNNEEQPQITSDNCSNADNSTLKGGEDFTDEFFDSPSNQKLHSDKSALLNRYLKNVCQRKDLELKIRNNKFFQNKLRLEKSFPSIIFPFEDVSDTFHVSSARMSRLIDKEVIENKRLSVRLLTANEPSYFDSFEDNVAIECNEKLRLQIFSYPNETLNRMMKVQSQYNMEDGAWTPLLVFITDYALYAAGLTPGGTEYDILCRLPHNELNAIAVGPEAQYVQIIDISGNIACSLVTGESSLGARLVSSLEWSARTSPLRVARPPAIIPLSCRHLAAAVARQRHQDKISEVLYYGRAWSGDAGDRLIEAPGAFAPPLEGYLMCRTDRSKRFEPCYFLLRAGVLQWGPHAPDSNTPLPNAIALRSVVGVRRHVDSSRRPHCFEIAMNTGSRLLLAAPDDPAASSWLQSLLLHAAQALEEKNGPAVSGAGPPRACSLLVTAREVLSVREPLEPAFVAGAAAYLQRRGSGAPLAGNTRGRACSPGAGPPRACSLLVTAREVLSVREPLEPAFVAGAAAYLQRRGSGAPLAGNTRGRACSPGAGPPRACSLLVTAREVLSVREPLEPAFVAGAAAYLQRRGSGAPLAGNTRGRACSPGAGPPRACSLLVTAREVLSVREPLEPAFVAGAAAYLQRRGSGAPLAGNTRGRACSPGAGPPRACSLLVTAREVLSVREPLEPAFVAGAAAYLQRRGSGAPLAGNTRGRACSPGAGPPRACSLLVTAREVLSVREPLEPAFVAGAAAYLQRRGSGAPLAGNTRGRACSPGAGPPRACSLLVTAREVLSVREPLEPAFVAGAAAYLQRRGSGAPLAGNTRGRACSPGAGPPRACSLLVTAREVLSVREPLEPAFVAGAAAYLQRRGSGAPLAGNTRGRACSPGAGPPRACSLLVTAREVLSVREPLEPAFVAGAAAYLQRRGSGAPLAGNTRGRACSPGAGPPRACSLLVTAREVLSVREPLEPAFVAGAAAYLQRRGSGAPLAGNTRGRACSPGAGPPRACSLLVTAREVLSVREPLEPAFVAGAAAYLQRRGSGAPLAEYIAKMRTDVEILACGSIKNLTAFKIPDTDENWCCLEWSVCEAREPGSGLALVVGSGAELERLIAAVERAFTDLTSEPFPLSVVEASKSACSKAHSMFEAAWTHMLPQQ